MAAIGSNGEVARESCSDEQGDKQRHNRTCRKNRDSQAGDKTETTLGLQKET